MAYNYIDTPRTDAGDHHLSAANISFSEVQGFPSPSKDPSNNLMGQMRTRTGGALKTPRARNALANLRAGSRKNEFTPLLKSAAVNRFRTETHTPRRHDRDGKENGTDKLVHSMLASTNQAPQTPAYLKAGYKDTSRTPRLPVDSSMIDGDASRTSIGVGRTPGPPPAINSSTIMSTPIPEMPQRGQAGRADQGNVLTLREQEAKLAKLDKENFNLKLKIHFLDEALKRTGTDYQQGMIKENAELKIDKTTLAYELKQQQKALARTEKELEEYKAQLQDYADKVKRRQTDNIMKEELDRLRAAAEKNQQLAEEREEEIDELQKRLDLAEAGSDDKLQDLKDDIEDLEREVRQKEAEIDSRDEQIEALQEKLKSGGDAEDLQQELADLEAELETKDAALAAKDEEIAEMLAELRGSQDREKSTKKLRGDVDMLETEIRDKNALLDEKHEEIRNLQKRVQKLEAEGGAATQAKSAELRDKERLLEDKEAEIRALEERLKTARGSWDKEAQQTDARLHERDNIIQDRDSQLRDKARIIDEKDAEIRELQRRLDSKSKEANEAVSHQEKQTVQCTTQIIELQEKLRRANADMDAHIDRKNAEMQKLRKDLDTSEQQVKTLQDRLTSFGSPTKKDAMLNEQAAKIRQLEAQFQNVVDDKDAELDELERQLTETENELAALQTTMKSMSPSRGVASQVATLQQALEHALEEKEALEDEVAVLETSLEEAQKEKEALQKANAELLGVQARANGSPVKERNELRLRVKIVEKQIEDYKQQVELLEAELEKSWKTRSVAATPSRERSELRAKLADSEARVILLENRLAELEHSAPEGGDITLPIERRDLHNMLKDAQIEIENLQTQLKEQEKRMTGLMKKEGEARAQLNELRIERDDGIAELAERDGRISILTSKERELRTQLQELRDAKFQLDDVEMQLGAKKGSSSSHARREAELRSELRVAQSDIDELNRQIHQRDDRLQAALRKEQQLRDRLKSTRAEDAEAEVQALQTQLRDREKKLYAAASKENELRGRIKTLRTENKSLEPVLEAQGKTHEKELRGLSKQIQYLSARCRREESFRRDLVFIKRWFLLQVEMYGACNKADLKMLEEMGITPDMTVREKRPSLKAAGLAVIATIRMRKMKDAWSGSKKLHESLLKKLEAMKRV